MSLARKVLLTAFNGKLTGEPMDWPQDKIGDDIWMILDMENLSHVTKEGSSIKVYESTTKKCRFQYTGGYSMNHEDHPAIYKLVEVTS